MAASAATVSPPLTPGERAIISAAVDAAPPLSESQRANLSILLGGRR